MKCVPVHHGVPAVLHRDEPWLHRHSENGALHANLHNFKICITFDLVGILRWGFQHFGFLIIVILIIKSFNFF